MVALGNSFGKKRARRLALHRLTWPFRTRRTHARSACLHPATGQDICGTRRALGLGRLGGPRSHSSRQPCRLAARLSNGLRMPTARTHRRRASPAIRGLDCRRWPRGDPHPPVSPGTADPRRWVFRGITHHSTGRARALLTGMHPPPVEVLRVFSLALLQRVSLVAWRRQGFAR